MEALDIKILGSICATSDYYYELVEKAANKLGLNYTIEKIIDPEILDKYDVSIGCLYGYCPGCNTVNEDEPDKMHTPALAVNGRVRLHSCFPEDEEFEKILSEYK